jgi:hypothetical protein
MAAKPIIGGILPVLEKTMPSLKQKREKNSSDNQNQSTITTWIAIALSILSLLTAIISIFQSYHAQKVVQDEIRRNRRAQLAVATYVSENPELLSEDDRNRLSSFGIDSVSIIKNDFWRSEAFSQKDKLFYVFMIICNEGPGIARDINFDVKYLPKNGVNEKTTSTSVTQDQFRSFLFPKDCFTLLVDIMSRYDRSKDLKKQTDLKWTDIKIDISYRDTIDQQYSFDQSILSQPSIQLTK